MDLLSDAVPGLKQTQVLRHCRIDSQFCKNGLKGGVGIIKILLIVIILAGICCIGAAIACLMAAAREMELPDIEDIEIGE